MTCDQCSRIIREGRNILRLDYEEAAKRYITTRALANGNERTGLTACCPQCASELFVRLMYEAFPEAFKRPVIHRTKRHSEREDHLRAAWVTYVEELTDRRLWPKP
jgi:hypothetical protein